MRLEGIEEMKCIVFGGAGFLGEHLCRGLLKEGHEVIVYDRQSDKLELLKQKYTDICYIAGDFVKAENFDSVLSQGMCVFHLISTTVPSNTDVLWDVESNVIPTIRLLESCVRCNVGKIVYFSSGGTVYGVPKQVPIVEEHETNPISSYGIQKLMIEKYLHYYQHTHGLCYNVIRFANPYGEGQNPFAKQGVIAAFLARAIQGQPIGIWGDTKNVRDYIYIDDVVKAAIAAFRYQGDQHIFNIGSGIGVSLQEIITEIKKCLGKDISVEFMEGRKQDVSVNVLDISAAQKELQWEPLIGLDEGLGRMYKSWDSSQRCFRIY